MQAYLAGRCDVYTTDQSGLYSIRVQQPKPDDHLVLPEIISKEPLGPSVRQGDDQWLTVVKWVHYAMLNAEEAGITQANVGEMLNLDQSRDQAHRSARTVSWARASAVSNDFVVNIVKAVGNYGELFERNVGSGSRLKDRPRPEQTLEQGWHPIRAAAAIATAERAPAAQGAGALAIYRSAQRRGAEMAVISQRPGAQTSRAGELSLSPRGAPGHLSDRAGRRFWWRCSTSLDHTIPRPTCSEAEHRLRASASSTARPASTFPRHLIAFDSLDDLRPGVPGRAAQHAAGGGPRHRAGDRDLGFVIGIARLSTNWLVARLATVYVEVIRNVPLLLQLFFWYFAVLKALPAPRQSLCAAGRRLLNVARPLPAGAGARSPASSIVGADSADRHRRRPSPYYSWRAGGRCLTGQQFPGAVDVAGADRSCCRSARPPHARPARWSSTIPSSRASTSRAAWCCSRSSRTAARACRSTPQAIIAEIVRAGIQGVSKGQKEAGAGDRPQPRVSRCAWSSSRRPCASLSRR